MKKVNKEEGKATLISSQSCKLIDSNEVCFIVQFFNKIAGISTIFNSNKQNELTFNHIDLPSFTNPKLALVKETYDSIFEEIKYLLSSRGTNINSLISQLATKDANSNDVLGVVFNDKSEYIAFAPFVREYLLKTQNFDTYTTDHIHKMEEPKEMTEIPEESLSKIKNLNICIFRNIEGLPFAVKDNNERENIENSIKKTIEESFCIQKHLCNNCRWFEFDSNTAKWHISVLNFEIVDMIMQCVFYGKITE